VADLARNVLIADCCRLSEAEDRRLVRTPDGVWRLFRWGPNPDAPDRAFVVDMVVHFCPLCGAPLDVVGVDGLGQMLMRVGLIEPQKGKHEKTPALEATCAPTRQYRGGNAYIDMRLADLARTEGRRMPQMRMVAPARPCGVEGNEDPGE